MLPAQFDSNDGHSVHGVMTAANTVLDLPWVQSKVVLCAYPHAQRVSAMQAQDGCRQPSSQVRIHMHDLYLACRIS